MLNGPRCRPSATAGRHSTSSRMRCARPSRSSTPTQTRRASARCGAQPLRESRLPGRGSRWLCKMACYGCSSPRKAGGSAAALGLKIVVPLTGSLHWPLPTVRSSWGRGGRSCRRRSGSRTTSRRARQVAAAEQCLWAAAYRVGRGVLWRGGSGTNCSACVLKQFACLSKAVKNGTFPWLRCLVSGC